MTDTPVGTSVGPWLRREWALLLGIGGMLTLVAGTFLDAGALLQRLLFLIGAVAMGVTAYATDERMLATLQAVITLGGVLAFFEGVAVRPKLVVLCGTTAAGTGWLIYTDYHREDRWWPIGAAGLFCLSVAFAVSGSSPIVLNGLLTVGTLFVLFYSGVSFFVAGVRVQAIWVVLNTVFFLNPARRTVMLLGIL